MLITPKKYEETKINQKFFETLISNGIEEGQHLEYKKQLGSNPEIAKDISSFANSDGGNIIYGIEENNHKPFHFITDWATPYHSLKSMSRYIIRSLLMMTGSF